VLMQAEQLKTRNPSCKFAQNSSLIQYQLKQK